MTVEYEQLRAEMIQNLRFLVDKRFGSSGQFQQPNGWWVTASDTGLFFLDALNGLTIGPQEIGRIFEKQEELDAIRALSEALESAFHQPELEPDSALILSSGWRTVEAVAARALSIIQTSKSERD